MAGSMEKSGETIWTLVLTPQVRLEEGEVSDLSLKSSEHSKGSGTGQSGRQGRLDQEQAGSRAG